MGNSSRVALVGARKFHPFRRLDAGDDHGVMLDIHVRLQNFNVQVLTFLGRAAAGAPPIECEVVFVGSNEALDGGIHPTIFGAGGKLGNTRKPLFTQRGLLNQNSFSFSFSFGFQFHPI
jgi:hypothetical protein